MREQAIAARGFPLLACHYILASSLRSACTGRAKKQGGYSTSLSVDSKLASWGRSPAFSHWQTSAPSYADAKRT